MNKQKIFKRFYYLVFFSSLFFGILKIYDRLVDGFYISRVYGFLPTKSEFEFKHDPEDTSKLHLALNQPFYYLGSGSQCYAFKSSDGKYVLKFFKNYRWKPPYFFNFLPKTRLISRFEKKICSKKLEGIFKTYRSAKLSYTLLKKETALIYLQLNPKPQKESIVTLYNKLGKKYTLNLSEIPFALQYFAKPMSEVLLGFKKNKDLKGAKACINELILYTLNRRKFGITDSDPHFINNFGYYENHAISLDIGGIFIDPKKGEKYFYSKELNKISKKILPWLHKNFPQLEEFTEDRLEKLRKNSCF